MPELRSFDELKIEVPKTALLGLAGGAAALTVLTAAPQQAQAAVQFGDRCAAVGDIQTQLQDEGYDISVDQVFGSATESAVKRFQRAEGLSADGIVGTLTAEALGLEDVDAADSPYLAGNSCSATGGGGNPGDGAAGTYTVSSTNGILIRSSASTSGTVVGSYGYGDSVQVTSERKTGSGYTWAKLANRSGWVATSFLSSSSSGGGGNPGTGTAGTYTVTSGDGIVVRSSASTSSTIIGSYGYRDSVQVTSERRTGSGYTWAKLANRSGWVATSFLSSSSSGGGGSNRYVVSTGSGLGVIIRDEPDGDEIGGLAEGATVRVTGESETAGGYEWLKLSGRSGWVAADFLDPA
ncbi:MAG TPA: SH3 domain-containing protein [Chroococcidiopsis sp.]